MAYKVRKFDELYAEKDQICMKVVAIMKGALEDRGMELIEEGTRTACAGEIHELIVTDERAAGPGATVDRVAYLGFGELSNGGVLAVGDELFHGEELIGELAGFDYNHMPNHMNIVFYAKHFRTGTDLGLALADGLTLKRPTTS